MTDRSVASVPRPRGRPRNEAADIAIIEATLDGLIDSGIVGLTMESVAARAGVAKTTLYRRYPNSADLAAAALQTLNGRVRQPPPGTTREQLMCAVRGVYDLWSNVRFAAIMRRIAADANVAPELFRDAQRRIIAPHIELIHGLLARAVDEGLIRSDIEVGFVRIMMVAPIIGNGLTSANQLTPAQVDEVVETVLRGLAP